MNNRLKEQIARFKESGSYNLTNPMKIEIAALIKSQTGKVINVNSTAQIREALNMLATDVKNVVIEAIEEKIQDVIEKLEDMTLKELKEIAKERGIKGSFKKSELIDLLNNANQLD